MRIPVSNVLFFCVVGFVGDTLNYTAVQSEIFLAAGRFGASERQMGLLGTLTNLGYALPAFAAGALSERLGRRAVCLTGVGGLFLSYLLMPFVQSITQLVGLCFVRSIFSACLWPPLMAWMARAEEHGGLNSLLGKYNVSWAFGILMGFYLAGVTFTRFGWQSGFYLAAVLALMLFIFMALCDPHGGIGAPGAHDEETTHGLHEHEVRHFVKSGLIMMTAGTFLTCLVVYLFPKVGGDLVHEKGQSMLNVIRLAGTIVAFFAFGRTTGWHYRRWPLVLCGVTLALGVILVASGHSFWTFAAGYAFTGAGFGIGFTMSAFYALGLSNSKGKGSGVMETLVGGGSLLGPLYGGELGSVTGARFGVMAGLVPLAVAFIFSMLKPGSVRKASSERSGLT